MAYVTINWEYDDASTIEGFRLYRDDILRGEFTSDIREAIDDVSDTTETRVKYSVKAFDSTERESYGCYYGEVLLLSIVTPIMTADNQPAGLVVGYHSGPAGNGYDNSGIINPYKNFNRNEIESISDGSGFQMGDDQGSWMTAWEYRFSDIQRIAAIGIVKDQINLPEEEYTIDSVKLYGSNEDGGILTLISEITWEPNLTNGTLITKVLDNAVYYKNYRIQIDGQKHDSDTNNSNIRRLFSEIYLYNRDEVS